MRRHYLSAQGASSTHINIGVRSCTIKTTYVCVFNFIPAIFTIYLYSDDRPVVSQLSNINHLYIIKNLIKISSEIKSMNLEINAQDLFLNSNATFSDICFFFCDRYRLTVFQFYQILVNFSNWFSKNFEIDFFCLIITFISGGPDE